MADYQLQVPDIKGIKSKKSFIDTGRIVPTYVFKNSFPNENLHFDCGNVVVYAGGHYIQMLSTKEFLHNNFSSKSLDDVENYLWKEIKK